MKSVDKKNLSGLMRKRLPAKVYRLLKSIGAEGKIARVPAYLVGGTVRDLLMGAKKDFDVDVVVEGDGIVFARRMGRMLKSRVVAYPRLVPLPCSRAPSAGSMSPQRGARSTVLPRPCRR